MLGFQPRLLTQSGLKSHPTLAQHPHATELPASQPPVPARLQPDCRRPLDHRPSQRSPPPSGRAHRACASRGKGEALRFFSVRERCAMAGEVRRRADPNPFSYERSGLIAFSPFCPLRTRFREAVRGSAPLGSLAPGCRKRRRAVRGCWAGRGRCGWRGCTERWRLPHRALRVPKRRSGRAL